MTAVRAVARLALRESLRSWTLAALTTLFSGALLLAALTADPQDRFRVLLGAAGQASHLLLLLSSLLLGALALPQEISRRSVFHLFSKPLGRGAYLLGRWIGLSSTLLILALLFWAVSTAAVSGRGHIRLPRNPVSGTPVACTFRLAGEPAAERIEAELDLAEPPARLEGSLRDASGLRPLLFTVNTWGNASAELPALTPLPDGTCEVFLPLPPGAVGRLRMISTTGSPATLLAGVLLVDWAQASFLGAAALAASTFLSGPVALFCAAGLACLSYGHGLMHDLEAILLRPAALQNRSPFELAEPAPLVREASGTHRFLTALRLATPDLAEMNLGGSLEQAESPPLQDRSRHPLMGPLLGSRAEVLLERPATGALTCCSLYSAAALSLGWLCLSRRELGR